MTIYYAFHVEQILSNFTKKQNNNPVKKKKKNKVKETPFINPAICLCKCKNF